MARSTASSTPATALIATTGPKLSSVIAAASSGTPVSTTGATYGARTDSGPPSRARAPAETAPVTCRSTIATWPACVIGP
ncbi:hypothetical protein TU94_30200 [Streptomyces cyaneogriseus subsp. noncyanogenus]|uniref:Uncharacterized protein n=1 Tax=Streptomyces cyaneogriseus subsp. noncyanogenus TaxID=477245 RepID=A0A0C5G8I5_9ACTN|nr:hypothetical protein TU94_30200 [Streptomyces cyaneogriseus subsp. noncyanogenus]